MSNSPSTSQQSYSHWIECLIMVCPVIPAALLSIALTTSIWVFVYDCKNNPLSQVSDSGQLVDGMLKAFAFIFFMAFVGYLSLVFVLYDFQRFIMNFLRLAAIITFVNTMHYVRDILKAVGLPDDGVALNLSVTVIGAIYGTIQFYTFFADRLSPTFHHYLVICNCSVGSLTLLRMMPQQSIWFLLGVLPFWDLFAVLSSNGPLNRLKENTKDYTDSIFRFVFFQTKMTELSTLSHESANYMDMGLGQFSTSGPSFSISGVSISTMNSEVDDDNDEEAIVRIGQGDFVFFGVLVAKSAESGSLGATLAATVGIVVGLIATFSVPLLMRFFNGATSDKENDDEDDTFPALPFSIALGMLLHFGWLFADVDEMLHSLWLTDTIVI